MRTVGAMLGVLLAVAAARAPAQTGTVAGARAAPGYPLSVNLGRGVALPFVWIGPMALWVGPFEVTNGQYRRYDAGHASAPYYGHVLDGDDQPAVDVSWEDARNFCDWLTRHYGGRLPEGYVFRLPTDAEWLRFASCGERRPYPWGHGWPPPGRYNYRGEEGVGLLYRMVQRAPYIRGHHDGFIVTAPVAQSGANAWGLYGVGGNVWEWGQDWADERRLTRVLRGGCWDNDEPDILALAHRADAHPDRRNAMIGFRVVVAPALAP